MKLEIFLTILLLLASGSSAQNGSVSGDNSSFLSQIPDVELREGPRSGGEQSFLKSKITWIIILGLVFSGVLIYSFEIDPKWIALILAVSAVIFILTRLGIVSG